MKDIHQIRQDFELPSCIENWGWKFHHLGIPTEKVMLNERYLPHLKFHVSGFSTSPFGIEWMRFDEDCPISDLIKTVPHIAFVTLYNKKPGSITSNKFYNLRL